MASAGAKKRPPKKIVYDEIWKEVFFAGTEWDQVAEVEKYRWDFDHLDDALNDGGHLAGKTVHLFGVTEPQLVHMGPEDEKGSIIPVPAIIAVDCECAPPATVGIKSVQRTEEEIVPMSKLKMLWLAYRPMDFVDSTSYKPRVHVLKCEQRRARLRNMTEAAVHEYDYVLPYIIRPGQEDEMTMQTDVQVIVEIEGLKAPLMIEYDFELDDIDEFVAEQLKENDLDEKHDKTIRTAIKETVRDHKRKFKEEKAARKKRIDDIPEKDREAMAKMRLLKFYPQNETPNLEACKSKFINRYYGLATTVL